MAARYQTLSLPRHYPALEHFAAMAAFAAQSPPHAWKPCGRRTNQRLSQAAAAAHTPDDIWLPTNGGGASKFELAGMFLLIGEQHLVYRHTWARFPAVCIKPGTPPPFQPILLVPAAIPAPLAPALADEVMDEEMELFGDAEGN